MYQILWKHILADKNPHMEIGKLTGLHEEYSHPSGPCIPGVHKLFVDVLGNYYPCEKVCEESKDMIIGNVESGLISHK